MIRMLIGTVLQTTSDSLVINVGGMGYEVFASSRIRQKHPAGSEVQLDTYLVVKEDALQLYGFENNEERRLFEMLVSVSGVGPKTALSVLEKSGDQVVEAIQQSDVGFFSGVPRLGKKTAQKIIVELQSKVGKGKELDLSPESTLQQDIRAALLGLGYSSNTIETVIRDLPEDLTLEKALKWSLQQLSKGK